MASRHIVIVWAAAMAAALPAWADVAVTGRVMAPDGKPIVGAAVTAHARETAEEAGERHVAGRPRAPLTAAKTGAGGTFRLEASRPIAWVEARAEGFVPGAAEVADDGPVDLTLVRGKTRRGVIRGNGAPVSGAIVVWSSGSAEEIVRSGPDGSYEVPDPDQSPGMIQVIHPGFAPLQAPVVGEGLDQELAKGVAVAGTVVDAAGRPVAGATLYVDGDLPAAKSDAAGAFAIPHAQEWWTVLVARTDRLAGVAARRAGSPVVTMTAPRSVSGIVREEKSGQPVAAATVVATSTQGVSVSADTDARGQYVLAGLPSGRYRLYAGRDGFVTGPPDYATAPPLDLREAPSGKRDFALARRPRITGRVEDEEKRPVDGALVFLGFQNMPAVYVSAGPFGAGEASTRTRADGSFRLEMPAADEGRAGFLREWSINVMKPGYAATQMDGKAVTPGTPATLRLTRGMELKGRVTAPDGAPLAGVAIQAAEDGAFAAQVPTHMVLASMEGEGWTSTDAAGAFVLHVRPVAHHLSFRKAGHAFKLVRGHDPRSAAPLVVTLEAGAALRGKVARAGGSGIAGVTVSASREMGLPGASAVTGPDGAFEMADLAPGLYQLTATHAPLGLHLMQTVEAPATDLQMLLGPTGAVRGRVTDAATGLPIPRFKIQIDPDEASRQLHREVQTEDENGAFTIADVPVGSTGVTAAAPGYATKRADATVSADAEPAEVELALVAEAPIVGRVTTEAKVPVPEARVTVEAKDDAERTGASTDDDGAFELRGLAPGTVTLAVEAKGYLPEKRTLDTRESARADFTLRKGLALRGEVVHQGAAVAHAYVSAGSSLSGAASQDTETDERGRFTLEGLVPGRYTVSAYAEGKGEGKLEDVDVEHAGSVRLVLQKAPTAILTGTVIGLPAGEEPGFVSVNVTGEESASAQGVVDAAHAFRIEDAPAGRVQVRATATWLSGTARSSRAVDLTLTAGTETETVLRFSGDAVVTGVVVRDAAPVPGLTVSFAGTDGTGATGRTDARGAYEVAGLEPGQYQVNVSGDGGYFSTSHAVEGSGEFDIDITGGSLGGRVVRADDGAPLAGVTVSLFQAGENQNTPATSASTNALGVFLARSLHEGTYRIITSKAGYGQAVRTVDVTRGATADVVLELSPADGISVTVVDARDNRPLEAIVVVRDMARQIVANQHSGVGPEGALNIPLSPGPYLLSTSASGYGTVTRPVTAPGQGLRVGLTPGGTLVIESPRDLRGRVRLVQPDGEEYVRCWCNGIADIELRGRWTSIENVTPDTYTVQLVDAPEGVAAPQVTIREGQTSTVTIE